VNGTAPVDTLGMWEATAALPEQLSGARRAADGAFAGLAAGGGVRSVAAFGLGTGGIACAAVAGATMRISHRLARPMCSPMWCSTGAKVDV